MRRLGKRKFANTFKKSGWADDLSTRIREVRASTFGPRGRAKFARAVGVSPSTYSYYEGGRIPPMPILLRMSDVAGVDLRWLLTGRLSAEQLTGARSAEHAKILTRMGALLPQRAEAAAALNALLDLLEAQPEASPRGGPEATEPSDRSGQASSGIRIPVLGRTAAGVPQFWGRPGKTVDLLQSAINRCAGSGESLSATLSGPENALSPDSDEQVYLVQLAKPVRIGELHIAEFLECQTRRDRWANAFALRVDGDSMHPSLFHGDLVILSPTEHAKPGRAAVVQLRNQIGVTCKLFYSDKKHVRLIPINEQFRPTKHPRKDLVWALRVLSRVRLSG